MRIFDCRSSVEIFTLDTSFPPPAFNLPVWRRWRTLKPVQAGAWGQSMGKKGLRWGRGLADILLEALYWLVQAVLGAIQAVFSLLKRLFF